MLLQLFFLCPLFIAMLRNIIRRTSRVLTARASKQAITKIQHGLFLNCKNGKKSTKLFNDNHSGVFNSSICFECQRRNLWWGAAKKAKTEKQIQTENDPKKALEAFDQVMDRIDKNDPESAKHLGKALYGKAKSHALLNQLDQAIEFASKATEADPTDGHPYFLRGSLYLDSGDKIKAEEQFLKAVKLTPDIYFAWIALAQIHFKDRNFEKAKEYAEIAGDYGYDETLFYILGVLATNARDLKLAEEYLRKSLKLNHKDPEVLTFLSAVCMEKGQYQDALDLINRALKLTDNRPGLWLSKGEVCFSMEEFDDAVVAYEKYLTFDKRDPQALYGIANSLLLLGHIDDAFTRANELIEAHPNDNKGWSTLAAIYMAKGNKEEALKCYNKSIDLTPNITDEKREKIRAKMIEQVKSIK